MGPCYQLAFLETSELMIAILRQWVVATDQAGMDELTTWKNKRTLQVVSFPRNLLVCGIRHKCCSLPRGNEGVLGTQLHC